MISRPRTIAIGSHDAGGMRAILPVARALHHEGHHLRPLLAGPSIDIWKREGPDLPPIEVPDNAPETMLGEQLRSCDLLLSAAGLYNQIEHTLRLAAKALKIPIVALLDSWLNYRERFQRQDGNSLVTSRPDTVCAIDQLTHDGLLEAGFSPEQIVLTGHPGLEWAQSQRTHRNSSDRETFLLRYQLDPSLPLATFFSDPYYIGPDLAFYSGPGAIMNPDGSGRYGYTVREVLPAFLEALEQSLEENQGELQLVIRPHPSEFSPLLDQLVDEARSQRVRTTLITEGTVDEWIAPSHAVVGMMSIALLEAALGGKPVLSLQPGLPESGEEDPSVASLTGYAATAFDSEQLRKLTKHLAAGDWDSLTMSPPHPLPLEGATEQVLHCLHTHYPQ